MGWGGSVGVTSMALLHIVTLQSVLMAVSPSPACGFQGYPKSLYPASRLGEGEVKRYLWARPESEYLLLPTFHWPEVVTWYHLAAREVGKCSFWIGIHISVTLWKENVNLYWEDWHQGIQSNSHTTTTPHYVPGTFWVLYTYQPCSLGTIITVDKTEAQTHTARKWQSWN